MLSREQQFLEYADRCDDFARHANSDRRLAHLYNDLAAQWRHLAALVNQIDEDSRQTAAFFKTGR